MPKRKRSKAQELKGRRTAFREPGKVILIVCEGGETEPIYFKQLRYKLGLNPKSIHVEADCGNAPINVVDRAIELEKAKGINYDQIWCVFDTEEKGKNSTLLAAKDKAEAHKFCLAISNPCFEQWFLLHYENTARPFIKCAEVESYLKHNHLSHYDKSKPPVDDLFQKLDTALANAKILRAARKSSGDDVLSSTMTNVDLLVKQLKAL